MKTYKASFYNVLSPVEEEQEYLLYNIVSGGLEVLPWGEGEFLTYLQNETAFGLDKYQSHRDTLEYLLERGFLVESSIDEKEAYHSHYRQRQATLYERESASINLTVGTTIICNMGCPYCFEFVKPNKSLKAEENFTGILSYIREMIAKSPVERWTALNVTWYGGEPLINRKAISRLTPMLLELCEEHGINYTASIITNGILLTDANWQLLVENKVSLAQVTLDGPKQIHDVSRPLKGAKPGAKNYEQILENLARMPDGINAAIRLNVDRNVADQIDELFVDFNNYGIWPQRYKSVSFAPAWMRTYEEANEADTSGRLTNDEFFDFLQVFKKKRIARYNEWSAGQNVPKAKLKWMLPELMEECATWVSPYSLVVDPEGNIHKCWETIHDSLEAISHVNQGYDLEKHRRFMEYDRCELNPICSACKFMPVCDKLSCSHQAIKDGKPPCTYWKNRTVDFLRDQYLQMVRDPDSIVMPRHVQTVNTGHSVR
jgi:uncharacterized protein